MAATEAATAFLAATEEEASQILIDAHERGGRLASVDVRIQTYAARHEVFLESMRSNLNPDDFERAMTSARKTWAVDPRNPDAEEPASNSPGPGL
jgi:primosomal protein N'